MPLLTILSRILIVLGARLLIYIFAMLVGALSTMLGLKVAERAKQKREAARKAAREKLTASRSLN